MNTLAEKSLDLKSFRRLTKWSIYKLSRETGIPLQSLYNYLKEPSDPKYRKPKPYIERLLWEIYSHLPPI